MMILADTMISGEWLTAFGVAVISAIGGVIVAYKKGAASATQTTLSAPVPEVPTRKVFSPPSYYQHQALERRVDVIERMMEELRKNDADIRREQEEQFRLLLQAGETRKDSLLEKLEGVATGFHRRVDQLLELQRKDHPHG